MAFKGPFQPKLLVDFMILCADLSGIGTLPQKINGRAASGKEMAVSQICLACFYCSVDLY